MGSQWTSKYDIMRDLSLAQGHVPVDVDWAAADEVPPALNITEETEEEYYQCSGGGEFSNGPDLSLIRQMLDMVRDVSVSPDLDEDNDKLVITKLSSLSAEPAPPSVGAGDGQSKVDTQKRKTKQRNIAVESILKAIAKENAQTEHGQITDMESEPIKLLKPNDFKLSENKVNGAVAKPNVTDVKGKAVLALQPVSMFKRKKCSERAVKTPNDERVPSSSQHTYETYTPSSLSNEYYKMYLERSQLKQVIQEDIWSRAQRQMKEIDAKRKPDSAQSCSSTSSQDLQHSGRLGDQKLDVVRLPQHRHQLPGECVVCKVLGWMEDAPGDEAPHTTEPPSNDSPHSTVSSN